MFIFSIRSVNIMTEHMKKRLAELLVLALIASILAVPVMAATVITVDLGTNVLEAGQSLFGFNTVVLGYCFTDGFGSFLVAAVFDIALQILVDGGC